MFSFLRRSRRVLVLDDADAFWKHVDTTVRSRRTPKGAAAGAEERLDLRAAEAIKALLEREVGPEEGPDPVHMQDWDWHDDRCRSVLVLRRAFKSTLVPPLQQLLEGEFADFRIIVVLADTFATEPWGHLLLSATQVALQRNLAQAYTMASG